MSDERRKKVNFVSGGRIESVAYDRTCGSCSWLEKADSRHDGGWCSHSNNRVDPQSGWPDGFKPSVSSTGGCDLHPNNDPAAN